MKYRSNDKKYHLLLLPYSGPKGEKLFRSIKKARKNKLPENIFTHSAYSAMKPKDKFNIKAKSVTEHQHDITYYFEFPEENCNKLCR